MALRGFAVALLLGTAGAHPVGLQCGDERFDIGSATKCMTLDIVDKQDSPGFRFDTKAKSYVAGDEVQLALAVESPGPFDNSTGQDPYGIYFAITAKAAKSADYGSFTAFPDTVSSKDVTSCPHQIFAATNTPYHTLDDEVSVTWTAGANTCGEVSFTILWGNGPGDPPNAPAAPFMHRTVVMISGEPCTSPVTTTTTTFAEEWVCSVCAHVYNAEQDGAGVVFEELPKDWICPVCGQPKSAYNKQVTKQVAEDTWVCSVCAHVYDPDQDGSGVAFEDLPDDWLCPVCAQPKAAYLKQLAKEVAADTWVCSVCAHVYDPDQDGSGVAFEDLPDDWLCPVCAQPKTAYAKQAEELEFVV